MSGGYQTLGAGPEAVGRVTPWTLHLAALGGLILLLLALNWRTIVAAVTVWRVSPTFSHCFLIIPVCAWLIWDKRRALSTLTPTAWPYAFWLAIPVMVVSLAGRLAAVNELQQLAVIAFVQILVLAMLGPAVYRRIMFACMYLFFLVPMGEYLIGPLQRFTTRFIDIWLGWLGILHFTEGNVIQLANGAYQVAEACAGLRFLIATVAVGVLFAHFTYRKWHKIALFLVACVFVPIIGNGFRALGIVLLAHFSDNKIAVGADHLVYGWGFSVAILALLMFMGNKFADPPAPPTVKRVEPCRTAPHVLPLTLVAAIAVVSVVPAFAAWRSVDGPGFDAVAFASPPRIEGWSVSGAPRDWSPLYSNPDARLQFAMLPGDGTAPAVDVFVAYYTDLAEGHNLISSQNKMWDEEVWHPVSGSRITVLFAGKHVQMRELLLGSGPTTRLVWWSYVSGGRFTTSAMEVKLNRIRAAFSGRGGAAMIAVSTIVESDLEGARARLRACAAQLEPLKARIDSAGRAAPHSGVR